MPVWAGMLAAKAGPQAWELLWTAHIGPSRESSFGGMHERLNENVPASGVRALPGIMLP